MGSRVIQLAVLCALLPVAAAAGAWERAQGTGFVSLSYGAAVSGDADEGVFAFYAEYGLGRRLTFGVKVDQRPRGPHQAEIFLRRNFGPPDGVIQTAVELGIAADLDAVIDPHSGAVDPHVEMAGPKIALHLGRGFQTGLGGGWVDLRLGRVFPGGSDTARTEFDFLVGVNLGDRAFAMLEVWNDIDEAGRASSIAPTLGWRISPRGALTLRYVVDDPDFQPDRLEIGTWLEF